MSYHGYNPAIREFLHRVAQHRPPRVLEVGLDRGVTLIPIVVSFLKRNQKLDYVGIDVKLQESLLITLSNLDLNDDEQGVMLFEKNSLEILPELVKRGAKFDVVLLDGDHNYHTVSKELEYLNDLIHDESIVIIDDYDGRWSEKDLWYANREGYEDNKNVTKPIETEKHGVKAAVDEFLQKNADSFVLLKPLQGEPVVLRRKQQILGRPGGALIPQP